MSSLRVKLGGWDVERRFVVLRERIREEKEAVGRRLLDVPGYTYRVWVTNRTESALEIWRDYNGRATVEQRIEEMKNDLNADGFCTKKFFATEAAFLGVVLRFSESWVGLKEHIPLIKEALNAGNPIAPLEGPKVR